VKEEPGPTTYDANSSTKNNKLIEPAFKFTTAKKKNIFATTNIENPSPAAYNISKNSKKG
jgi:hypothetical protein